MKTGHDGPIRRYVECKTCHHYPAYHDQPGDKCRANMGAGVKDTCPCPGWVPGIDKEVKPQ